MSSFQDTLQNMQLCVFWIQCLSCVAKISQTKNKKKTGCHSWKACLEGRINGQSWPACQSCPFLGSHELRTPWRVERRPVSRWKPFRCHFRYRGDLKVLGWQNGSNRWLQLVTLYRKMISTTQDCQTFWWLQWTYLWPGLRFSFLFENFCPGKKDSETQTNVCVVTQEVFSLTPLLLSCDFVEADLSVFESPSSAAKCEEL